MNPKLWFLMLCFLFNTFCPQEDCCEGRIDCNDCTTCGCVYKTVLEDQHLTLAPTVH